MEKAIEIQPFLIDAKGMLRNRKLAKSISDVSWSAFVTKLQYKADWYEKKIIKIDKWHPSSQICSKCGIRTARSLFTFENGRVLFAMPTMTEI
jgi:transposase